MIRKLTETAYPLVTIISKNDVIEKPFVGLPTPQRGRGPASVEVISDFDCIMKEIDVAVIQGATVAWIRNTIKDAIETYNVLKQKYPNVMMFHSRFTVGDRADIEERVIQTFGKSSTINDRRDCAGMGKIIVATQVIEQSLDIDFDFMISDLAPVDLLFQRVGRLWRHIRANRPMVQPRFIIASPIPVSDPASDWLKTTSSSDGLGVDRTRWVYGDVGLLWRSVRLLEAEKTIGDILRTRHLIEAAYDEDVFAQTGLASEFVPEALQKASENAANDNVRAEWLGVDATTIKVGDLGAGYLSTNWDDDKWVRTRLGRMTVTLRLGKLEGTKFEPWYPPMTGVNRWALSEVVTNIGELARMTHDDEYAEVIVQRIKSSWSKFDGRVPLVVLTPGNDGRWFARVTGIKKNKDGTEEHIPYLITYNQTIGLEVVKRDD